MRFKINKRFTYILKIISLLIFSNVSIAQENHNCKIYQSIFEYQVNDTLNDLYFEIIERTESEIAMFGGTPYSVYFPDSKDEKKFRKQHVWGAYKDSAFFINNVRFSKIPGYNLLEYHGCRYLLMMGTASSAEVRGVTYHHNRLGRIKGVLHGTAVYVGIAYDIIEDKYFYLNEPGVQELLKVEYLGLSEYDMLKDKKDYQAIFRIIEKIDRKEYELSKH